MNHARFQRRPALILDASHRQALVALRALGRAGIEAWAADWRARPPTAASRWCAGTARLADVARDPDGFVDGVIGLCEKLRSPVIISCHDGSIEALRSRRSEIEQVGTLALPPEHALSVVVDKGATLAAAERLGIGVPRTRTVSDVAAATSAIDELGLPVVIKPVSSWSSQGSIGWRTGPIVAQSTDAAVRAVGRVTDRGSVALVQPWLSGSRDAVGIFLADDTVLAKFAVRSSRMYSMIGGDSVVRETVPMPPDIGPMAEALVREISFEGYGEVEFRRDRTGRPFLMEINPRLNAGVEVAVRAGVNVPLMLYRWAAGEPLRPALDYLAGVRMRWLIGDLKWLAEAIMNPGHPDAPGRRAAVSDFLREFARPAGYDYWDREDVRPGIREAAQLLGSIPVIVTRRYGRRNP